MHARNDHVEARQHVVGQVERAIFQDVDLHAGQDPEVVPGRGDVGVDRRDLIELFAQALLVQAVGDRQAGGVIGLHHVLVTDRHRGGGHCLDRRAAVAPCGVQVAVALERVAVHLAFGGDRHLRLGFDLCEIRGLAAGEGVGDHRGGRRTDAVEVGQRSGISAPGEFIGRCRAHDIERSRECLGLEPRLVGSVEAVDHSQQRLLGRHHADRTGQRHTVPGLM